MRVVIVEDEIIIREGIIKLLKRYYTQIDEIYEAISGENGLNVIRRHKPDLVITDIRMEPMNGLEMLEILLEQEKYYFKTIIISAYSDFSYARQGIKLGICEYLVKPIDVAEFRMAMKRVENEISKEKWYVSHKTDTSISLSEIAQTHYLNPVYPIEIEKDTIEALCAMDYNRINKHMQRLLQYFMSKKYNLETMKKHTIRYLLSIFRVAKEINFSTYSRLDEGEILVAVNNSFSKNDFEIILLKLLDTVIKRDNLSGGLLVQKALKIVEEYYHQGITLNEVALSLKMTPEHISSQFIKDFGVNFSTYIKNYRVKKAKELLLGTDLKLYEISERVGYNDAKYFSKVFKESEGIKPTEYRKKHK